MPLFARPPFYEATICEDLLPVFTKCKESLQFAILHSMTFWKPWDCSLLHQILSLLRWKCKKWFLLPTVYKVIVFYNEARNTRFEFWAVALAVWAAAELLRRYGELMLLDSAFLSLICGLICGPPWRRHNAVLSLYLSG